MKSPSNTLPPETASQIAVLYGDGRSVADISRETGCCTASVYNVLARLGLRNRSRRDLPAWELSPELQEHLRILCAENVAYDEIAAQLGWSIQTVKTAMKRLGLEKRRAKQRLRRIGARPEVTKAERDRIVSDYQSNVPISTTAEHLGRSAATLYNVLAREGLRQPAYRKADVSKLSAADRATLHEMAAEGLTYREIAERLGLRNYQQAKGLIRQAGLHIPRIHKQNDPTKKWCTVCKKEKDPSEFGFSRSGERKKVTQCKKCRRDGLLWKNYGITGAEYDRRFVEQSGACAICQQPETEMVWGEVKPLCVDHVHDETIPLQHQKVRGLLCSACNKALGTVRDDVDVLRRMIKYLLAYDMTRTPRDPKLTDDTKSGRDAEVRVSPLRAGQAMSDDTSRRVGKDGVK